MADQDLQTTLDGDNFQDRLKSLLATELFSDVVVKVVDSATDRTYEVRAHRCILAVGSPIWEASLKWLKGDVLTVTGMTKEIAQALILFTYTGRITFDSMAHCVAVLNSADYHIMPRVIDECVVYLKKAIMEEDLPVGEFVNLFNKAAALNLHSLIEACLQYVEYNSHELFGGDLLFALSKEAVHILVSRKHYFCSEYELIKFTFEWVRMNITDKSHREYVQESGILKSFRYDLLDVTEILDVFNSFPGFFNDDERDTMLKSFPNHWPPPIDYLNVDHPPRGTENLDRTDDIVVGRPPLCVVEEFLYLGSPTTIPIQFVTIEPRCNSYGYCPRSCEDSMMVNFDGLVTAQFAGPVNSVVGTVVNFPTDFNLQVTNMKAISITIILNRPGIYKKNGHFLSEGGFVRLKRGIIRNINNTSKFVVHSYTPAEDFAS